MSNNWDTDVFVRMAGKKQRTKSNCFPNLSFAEFRRGVKGADCQLESSLGRRKSVGHRIALIQNGYRIVTEWSNCRRRMDTGLPYKMVTESSQNGQRIVAE